MKRVALGNNQHALVDDADLPLVAGRKWRAVPMGPYVYAISYRRGTWATGRSKYDLMHRLILPDVPLIDHQNQNGLDNRRKNLRPATRSQNAQNGKLRTTNTSGYKGVGWWNGRWFAKIVHQGKQVYLGR